MTNLVVKADSLAGNVRHRASATFSRLQSALSSGYWVPLGTVSSFAVLARMKRSPTRVLRLLLGMLAYPRVL